MMEFPNGPVKFASKRASVGVMLKQRPQASPKLWLEPNAISLTAAVNPVVKFTPHAAEGHRAQRAPRGAPPTHENKHNAYRELHSYGQM